MVEESKSNLIKYLGYLTLVLLGLVMVLQLLLAAGVLPVSMAWGGRETELTPALRGSSLIAVLILGAFAYVIARRTGILGITPSSLMIKVMSWLISGYLGLNMLGNFNSQSAGERWLFGPITLILFISCLIISASKSAPPVETK